MEIVVSRAAYTGLRNPKSSYSLILRGHVTPARSCFIASFTTFRLPGQLNVNCDPFRPRAGWSEFCPQKVAMRGRVTAKNKVID